MSIPYNPDKTDVFQMAIIKKKIVNRFTHETRRTAMDTQGMGMGHAVAMKASAHHSGESMMFQCCQQVFAGVHVTACSSSAGKPESLCLLLYLVVPA